MFLMYSLLLPASVIYCLHAPCHLFMPFGLEAKMVRKSRPPSTKSKMNKNEHKMHGAFKQVLAGCGNTCSTHGKASV